MEGISGDHTEFMFTEILPNDAARVAMLLQGLVKDVPVVTPNFNQKNAEKASKLREEGNTKYRRYEFNEALSLYTQSMSLAPPNSEALPLAFANRALVLKDMGYLRDSIADCQRALKTGYPDNQVHKLHIRQGTCYEKLGQVGRAVKSFNDAMEALDRNSMIVREEKEKIRLNIESQMKYIDDDMAGEEFEDLTHDKSIGVLNFEVPSLGSNVNREIPSASDCIALKYNKTFGRHLVATRDIEPGEVLIVEEPFAAVLETSLSFSHCSHCFKLCRTLLPCRDCTWAMFCSEACIEESRSYHQLECAKMPGFLELQKNHSVHLVARLVYQTGFETLGKFLEEQSKSSSTSNDKRTAGFNKNGKYVSSDLNSIANLCYHKPRNFNETLAYGMMTAKLMKMLEFNKLPFSHELGGFLMKFFSSMSCNCNGVTEFHKTKNSYLGEIKPVAPSIFPTFALINHSCVSNIFYHFYGKTLVVRAGKFITKGSQLFEVSGKSFLKYSKQVRQKFTLEALHFQCSCHACVGNWPQQEGLLPAPIFPIADDVIGSDPLQKKEHMEIMSSLAKLLKECVGDTDGWRVEEHNLHLFKNHIKLMDIYGKDLCMQYHVMKECIRIYYNMLGNHVGTVQDDGLVNHGPEVILHIQDNNFQICSM